MISAGEFRNGVTFEMDGSVFQVVEFQHVKPGKGAAFVRTKYKNLKTGSVVERSFNPNEKFEQAQLERTDMSYLYRDGDLHYFMNVDTYEQIPFNSEVIGDALEFLKENMVCKVLSYKGEIYGIEPPLFVELEVTECEPGVKGDTATNVMKNATVETGAVVRVPLFINQGEKIRIDTRTGEYIERA
jgi:elongation factor P